MQGWSGAPAVVSSIPRTTAGHEGFFVQSVQGGAVKPPTEDSSGRTNLCVRGLACSTGAAVALMAARANRRAKHSAIKRSAHETGRRRSLAGLGVAIGGMSTAPHTAGAEGAVAPDPAAPTVSREVAPGIYAFDQAYGIPGLGVGANIPIRMTAIKLRDGGVLVYNPCHPTKECMQQFKDLGLTDVRYLVLGTIAVEHKYYGPQWADLFPKAEVWVSPRTFSWPIDFGPNVPFGGFRFGQKLQKIPKDSTQAPWYNQGIDHLQLTVDYAPRTVFEETVLYHQDSGTMVCTDMLIGLSDNPPEILTRSPYKEGLLYFSRNTPLEVVDEGSPVTLRDGYQKSTLLLNNINPRSLLSYAAGDLSFGSVVAAAFQAPQKQLGYYGWYPCDWQDGDSPCAKLDDREVTGVTKDPSCRPGWRGEWARLTKGVEGTGFQVPSFVAELQISRDPEAVTSFADEIARRWTGIKRVVPSHFDAPLPATAESVRKAISAVAKGTPGPAARAADLSAISNFKDYLEANDLIYKPASGRGQWRPTTV
mmetsp:Transcript_31934/g.74767  ORF Transcript_31934/g.74767 Transcript_31934/m.74767 type:complete len:534 (-) Transcript_31934:84-1685(-)